MTAMEQFQEAKKRREQAIEEANKIARNAFEEAAREIFDAHPLLRSFSWTQYTPYFNDGDECVFGTNTDDPSIGFGELAAYGDEERELEEEEFMYYSVQRKIDAGATLTPDESAGHAVWTFLRQFAEEDYKACFGDHVEVRVTREGITV